MRRILLALAVALGILLTAVPVSAQTSYEGGADLVPSPPTIVVCTTSDLTGTGFIPGSQVTVTVDGEFFITVTADGSGTIRFPYTPCTIPEGGVALFSATDGTNTATTQVWVTPVGTTPAPVTGALPRTGSDSGLLVRVAVVAIALGAVLVFATRRRTDDPVERDLTPTG